MNLKIRLYIEDENNDSFMGIGVLWLLSGIDKHKSIRKAALEMDMSYTKAFNILKNLEKSLNQPILIRNRGGNDREGTTLTEFGHLFLESYKKFNDNVEKYSRDEFNLFMKKINL